MNEQNPPDAAPKKATVPTVPLVEWKSLYELASRVRQNEPWRTLTDTELFALEDPVTKQVGRSQELQEFRSCRSSGEKTPPPDKCWDEALSIEAEKLRVAGGAPRPIRI